MKISQLHVTKIYIAISLSTFALSGCAKSFSQSVLNESPLMSQQWQVVRVSDGDTIAVRQGQREMKIRFCGIDSPEIKHGKQPGQPLGLESKANLQRLVNEVGGKVSVVSVESDRYGRTVAEVFSSKNGVEKNFNEEQLSSGFAIIYPQYVKKCPNGNVFIKAEAIAQSKKLGVWSGNFQKPWDYRRQQRSR
ncbi:thermonuclease family protein [uncultured Nostoc sp.]|uniref:thermonuclease family protein n=1 Tax=uncultured Nostoc sp. TaxID=340711 RepID=UPI0035CC0F1C